MTRLHIRRRPEQAPLLAACTTSRPVPAAHLGRRADADKPISFADIRRLPEPEWADTNPASRARFWPGRFAVGALIPAGQLAAVPLPTVPEPEAARVLDDIDTVTADVAAAFAARPELRHHHAVLMSLAPVLAQLAAADAERMAAQQEAQELWFATEVLGLDGNRDFGEQLRERDAETRMTVWSDVMVDEEGGRF